MIFHVSIVLTALTGALALLVAIPVDSPSIVSAQGQGTYGHLTGHTRVVVAELSEPAAATGQPQTPLPRLTPDVGVRSTAHATQSPEANALGSAEPGLEATAPPALSLTGQFEGLDDNDNVFSGTPPDPQLAVGPDHIVEFVNVVGRIFDKSGTALQTFALANFFGVPPGHDDFDPKIIYDALSQRWFASYVSLFDSPVGTDTSLLHLAVSGTSDPTGAWNLYSESFTDVFPDYPGIGVTDDKFTISVNLFDIDEEFSTGEQTIVVEKADVLAGVSDPATFLFPVNANRFTVRPAHSLSAISDQYLATFDFSSFTTLTLIRITGTPAAGNVTEAEATALSVAFQDSPPPSVTAGSGSIDSGDFRVLEAIWRGGRLWASASAVCTPPGDTSNRSCAHLMEVDTGTNSIVQDIMFGEANQYYSWPAIRTDSSSNLYVSLTHTSPSIFAEAVVVGRQASDAPNTISGSTLLRAGEIVHETGRWGDYLGAAVDPSSDSCVWVVGQYAKDTGGIDTSFGYWGTFIAGTSYAADPSSECNPSVDTDGDGIPDEADNCPAWPNSSQDLPAWPVPEDDPDCDGFTTVVEDFVGTDPLILCGVAAWPPDSTDDGTVSIADVLALKPAFNSQTGDANYERRLDLNADGKISIPDVLALKPFFGLACA